MPLTPLTPQKFTEIQVLIQEVVNSQDPSVVSAAIQKFKTELGNQLDTQSYIDGQSIAEYVVEVFVEGLDAQKRALFRREILEPVLKGLGKAIDTPNPQSKQPMLHQVLSSPPFDDLQKKSLLELLAVFRQCNANFNALDAAKGTPAHRVLNNWTSEEGLKFAPEVLKELYRYGCGFNRTNGPGHTLADMKVPDSVRTTIENLGGRRQAELSTDTQVLNSMKNTKPVIDRSRSLWYLAHRRWMEADMKELEDARKVAEEKFIEAGIPGGPIEHHVTDQTAYDVFHDRAHLGLTADTADSRYFHNFDSINTPNQEGRTPGHTWLLFCTDPNKRLSKKEQLAQNLRVWDDFAREEFAEFCAHGLNLKSRSNKGNTVLELMKRRGLAVELLKDPRVRTAFQSQFDHDTISSYLGAFVPDSQPAMRVADMKADEPAETSAPHVVSLSNGLVLFRSNGDIRANKKVDTSPEFSMQKVYQACVSAKGNSAIFNEYVVNLTAQSWKDLCRKIETTSRSAKKNILANLPRFLKRHYEDLAAQGEQVQAEFNARLPAAYKIPVEPKKATAADEKSVGKPAVPPAAAASTVGLGENISSLYGATAAAAKDKSADPKPPASVPAAEGIKTLRL